MVRSRPSNRLTRPAELLFRHVTSPGFVQDGRPTTQMFEPRPVDRGCVSVDRSAVARDAAASLAAFLARGFQSASVWGVTVADVNAVPLDAFASPSKANPAHAHIDMSALDADATAVAAVRLTASARARGCLAPPPESTGGTALRPAAPTPA